MFIPRYTCRSSISNKEGLIIGIGDSWTEGMGNYCPQAVERFIKREIDFKTVTAQSRESFYFKDSWPNLVATELNWDAVNIGISGLSNPGMAKKLINEFDLDTSIDFSRYNKVTVLVMLTDPARVSFYSNERLVSYTPFSKEPGIKPVYECFLEHVYLHNSDKILETRHALRSIELYCKSKNFNMFFMSAFTAIDYLKPFYDSPNNIHNYIDKPCMGQFLVNPKLFRSIASGFTEKELNNYLIEKDTLDWGICGHPGPRGYAKIARVIASFLKERY